MIDHQALLLARLINAYERKMLDLIDVIREGGYLNVEQMGDEMDVTILVHASAVYCVHKYSHREVE